MRTMQTTPNTYVSILIATAMLLGAAPAASAQTCAPAWDNLQAIGNPGLDGLVTTMAVFDDGTGPALYAGGTFTTAGRATVNGVAKWDGSSWSPLGSGVGGPFGAVWTLTVFDDGSGPALYAGGQFITAGGVTVNNIAKWNGAAWTALGTGLSNVFPPFITEFPNPPASVRALTVFDDGTGPALYVGGQFLSSGNVLLKNIAKWDCAAWTAVDQFGLSDPVFSLTTFDDGMGSALYVGGAFSFVNGVSSRHIAKWDSAAWSAVGPFGLPDTVFSLVVFDDGTGPTLYASLISQPFNTFKWDGSSWIAIGYVSTGGQSMGFALTVFDDGAGAALYAGGAFLSQANASQQHCPMGWFRVERLGEWNQRRQ